MTKDVAVVHWTEGTQEKSARAYTLQMLSQLVATMEKKGVVYIVCLTKLDTIIPTQPSKPFKPHLTPAEYVGRVEGGKRQQRALQEPTRTKQIQVRHPPPFDKVKEAFGQ